MKFYTGVGARSCPSNLNQYIKTLARKLDSQGYILRSGGAAGFDSFIESGATKKEIYLPWPLFNNLSGKDYFSLKDLNKDVLERAVEFAELYHPNFKFLSSGAQKMMIRNSCQIFGKNMNMGDASKFVICWTPNGKIEGGTGQALRIAESHQIPIFNLAKPEDKIRIDRWLELDLL